VWCVIVCDLENLENVEAMTRVESQRHSKKQKGKQYKTDDKSSSTVESHIVNTR